MRAPERGDPAYAGVGCRLHARLLERADGVVLRLVSEGSVTEVRGAELAGRAQQFATAFRGRDAAGHPVGVCLYHGLDLYAAFIGALWAGAIPTMLPPPSPRIEPAKYARSFRHVRSYIDPAVVAIDSSTIAALVAGGHLGEADDVLLNASAVEARDDHLPVVVSPDDVILVQHSSGTTGLQKGIALTSRSILTHNRSYARALGLGPSDLIVSWLPLYHDMGFIACFLMPFLEGIPVVAMSPFEWVQRPAMLFDMIHRFRGTLCWLPNFAFSFLASNVRDSHLAEDLDLSSIRAWINSSEPVSNASHRAFVARFERHGVTPSRIRASYAMAENVYAVTQSSPDPRVLDVDRDLLRKEQRIQLAEGDRALSLVSNGSPIDGTSVRIQDADRRVIEDGWVGEIAIRGDFVFSGYHQRPDLTAAVTTTDGWFCTGDLGFQWEGEVFVTGRKKDLIIVQGRNFYPADIEATVAGVGGVSTGRVAAFGLPDERTGTESLVILAEVEAARAGDGAIIAEIRRTVAQEFDCTPGVVRLLPERWLIKSSSGKMARAENRQKYLDEFVNTAPSARV